MSSVDIPRRRVLLGVPLAAAAGGAARSTNSEAATSAKSPSIKETSDAADLPPGKGFHLDPSPFWTVSVRDVFWRPKLETNATTTIPFEIAKLGKTECGLNRGVLQAAIYTLRTRDDPLLQAHVDARIRVMLTSPTLSDDHGFEPLRDIELAVAYQETTGRRELLDAAIALAAEVDADVRRRDPAYAGAEREALNCIQLFRATGNASHLALAKRYLDVRGRSDAVGRSRHTQSYLPVTEQTEAVGHAVNCVTLILSLIDYGVLSGDRTYFDAGHRMWTDIVRTKMYVSGGVGSSGNEGFGRSWSLPNLSAYAETCAVLMFMTLNHHLHLATGNAVYIDVMERAMYNNALSGVSHAGDHFFYVNRLASAGDGRDVRWQHASLECCPPNLVRFLAAMPGLIYTRDKQGAIHVNLYVSSSVEFGDGETKLSLATESGMPWTGLSKMTVLAAPVEETSIRLRIPGWARGIFAPGHLYTYVTEQRSSVTLKVNGSAVTAIPDRFGYVDLRRAWIQGDVIELDLPLEPRRVVSVSAVGEDRGRFVVERGPIIFCAEWPDVDGGQTLDLVVGPDAPLAAGFDPDFFGGATVITTRAHRTSDPLGQLRDIRLVPYHLWANRGPGEMTVWLLSRDLEVGDVGPAGGLIFYKNPTAAKDGWRYLEAAPFDQSAGAHWGCFRREIPGARGTSIGSGRRNTADMLSACAEMGSAAHLCESFRLSGISGWFLPSRDELAEMYRTLKAAGIGDFRDAGLLDNCEYWTSSQQTADMAGHIDFADNGRQHGDDKDFPRRVRAIRAF